MRPSNITLGELDLPDIGRHPESYWPLSDLRPGVTSVSWPWTQQKPDLSDCLAERLPGRSWLLQLWEPLDTKAPSPSRCQPYCCYIRTVIFYHRPYISRGGKPWRCNGRWQWISAPAGFVQFDQVETRLSWDDVVGFDGDWWSIGYGRVVWRYKRWWMMHTARRVKR